ncbi:sensor histidine kinase [Streptomyces sp. NPDC056660]|uniref:sensor histidine kinase n=1 Tax=Streptomyces sp. NPDC056660 TaxID=3345897 RepID=UPI0036AAC754
MAPERVINPGTAIDVTVEAAASTVQIQVADHGPGIPAEDPSRVFDRFWRADASRGRARGGSGLGLAIVHAHQGTMRVASTPGSGTTVAFVLPAYGGPPTPARIDGS